MRSRPCAGHRSWFSSRWRPSSRSPHEGRRSGSRDPPLVWVARWVAKPKHRPHAAPSSPARSRCAALRHRAAQAQHPVRERSHSPGRNRIAARVTDPIAPVTELGHRPLCPSQHSLQRTAYSDVGEPTHRLGGPIAYAFAEPQRAAPLRPPGQHRQALLSTVAKLLELTADRVEVHIAAGIGHQLDVPAPRRVQPCSVAPPGSSTIPNERRGPQSTDIKHTAEKPAPTAARLPPGRSRC